MQQELSEETPFECPHDNKFETLLPQVLKHTPQNNDNAANNDIKFELKSEKECSEKLEQIVKLNKDGPEVI